MDNQTSQLSVAAYDPEPGPSPLSYLWTVLGGGGALSDPTSPTPVYFPDNVNSTQTVTLQVEATDGAEIVSGTLTLQVGDADAPPPNQAPQISAVSASPASIYDTESSQLGVTASDPDNGPSGLGYQWTVVSGGGSFDNPASASPRYYPADVVGNQTVSLKVEVTDGAATTSSTLNVQVLDANPPPPSVELFSTNFTNGSLAGWTIHDEGTVTGPSKWKVDNQGRLFQNSNIQDGGATTDLARLGTYLAYDDGLGWTDYRLKFSMLTTGDDDVMGAMFRLQNADNYYRFTWDRQRKQRQLVKKSDGVFTLLASDSMPYNQYQTYQAEIVAQGGQLEVWIDGVRIFQVEDADHHYGSFAFHTWQNAWTYFDNVLVEDLSGGTFNVAPKITALSASPSTLTDMESSALSVVASDANNGPLPLSYQWTILEGGGTLDDAASPTPIYTPTNVSSTESVKLRVQVSDGEVAASGDLTLTVLDADAPPLGPVLLSQNFSGNSLVGWSVHDEGMVTAPSKWKAVQGRLFQNSNIQDGGGTNDLARLGTWLAYDAGMDWTGYLLKFNMYTTGDDDVMGVMFRVKDADNYYRFSWDKQRGQRRLVKKSGGVFTLLAADSVPYVQYQAYGVEIVARGDELEVWVSGNRIFRVADPDHTSGTFAFYTWQDAWAYFDDVVVNQMENP